MKFLTLLGKEMLNLKKNIGAVLILFIVPIFIILIMGYAFEDTENKYDIGIVNLDGDNEICNGLINGLKSVKALNVFTYETEQAARNKLKNGELLGFLVLPRGFDAAHQKGDAVLRLVLDRSKPVNASIIEGITRGFIGQFNSKVMGVLTAVNIGTQIAPEYKPIKLAAMAKKYVTSRTRDPITLNITSNGNSGKSQGMAGFSQTTCGMTAMFILFLCVLWGSLSILEEKLTGTLTRLRVSPASFVTIFGSKLVCTGLLAFLQFVLFFTIGHFALNVPVGNVYLLILTNIIYILQAAAMGLLISIFARSRLSAMGLSFLVIMMLSPLGGLWFPLEIVPVTLQKIAAFLPTGSFMIAMDKIINKDAIITTILPQLAVMSLYFAITFILSIKSGWIKKFRMA